MTGLLSWIRRLISGRPHVYIGGEMNNYRTQGRPTKHPVYEMKPGQQIVVSGTDPNKLHCCVQYIRRTKGWILIPKQLDFGMSITRIA